MRQIDRIIVHHTATSRHTTVEAIRNYHVHHNGWRDIGYHYLVDNQGRLRLGRPVDLAGAHCKGHNSDSIGLAMIGNFQEKGIGELQINGLYAALEDLCRIYPKAKILGHKELAHTLCPGRYIMEIIREWRV